MEKTVETQPPAISADALQQDGMETRYRHIPGWGMDADPKNNPTYPMKHYTGADHDRMNYERAPQQVVDMEVLKSIERPSLSRVYGTSVPPGGLSGVVRRQAYKYSEQRLAHWMTLILADRIDAVEGVVADLKNGVIPNLWVERGWRAEWKTNPRGVVRKVAAGVVVATVLITIISRKRKKRAM